jgi:hypothetical protein
MTDFDGFDTRFHVAKLAAGNQTVQKNRLGIGDYVKAKEKNGKTEIELYLRV